VKGRHSDEPRVRSVFASGLLIQVIRFIANKIEFFLHSAAILLFDRKDELCLSIQKKLEKRPMPLNLNKHLSHSL